MYIIINDIVLFFKHYYFSYARILITYSSKSVTFCNVVITYFIYDVLHFLTDPNYYYAHAQATTTPATVGTTTTVNAPTNFKSERC